MAKGKSSTTEATSSPLENSASDVEETQEATPEADAVEETQEATPDEPVLEAKGEFVTTVTVTVPKDFILQIDHFHVFKYKAGVQEMEYDHANHWYSKANGVTIYKK